MALEKGNIQVQVYNILSGELNPHNVRPALVSILADKVADKVWETFQAERSGSKSHEELAEQVLNTDVGMKMGEVWYYAYSKDMMFRIVNALRCSPTPEKATDLEIGSGKTVTTIATIIQESFVTDWDRATEAAGLILKVLWPALDHKRKTGDIPTKDVQIRRLEAQVKDNADTISKLREYLNEANETVGELSNWKNLSMNWLHEHSQLLKIVGNHTANSTLQLLINK